MGIMTPSRRISFFLLLGSFMCGIGSYYALPIEPSWSALLIPCCIATILILLALKFQSALTLFLSIAIFIIGSINAKYSTLSHVQAKIYPPQHAVSITARVWEAHIRGQGYGIIVEPLSMSSRNEDEALPKRAQGQALVGQI